MPSNSDDKGFGEVLAQTRETLHTPASAGVVLFDYLLSQGMKVGTLNAAGNTLEIPVTATIKVESRQGLQTQSHCTHTCLSINGINIVCVDKCVLE
jgi:hypothetical protein